jgi:hypothetical protein
MKAFPDRYYTKYSELIVHEGMDLRDYFAAKAMQAILQTKNDADLLDHLPRICYMWADAMMKEREV